jgi:diaminopimelate epimerase
MGPMTDTGELRFTKGHGTENDFLLVADLEGAHDVTVEQVRRLTDRRAGIGADGVIRVVPTQAASEQYVRDQGNQARWFMDYRNADGSAAEMCGNGTRVFAAYLRREGLEMADEFAIATRSGVKLVTIDGDLIAVNLGGWSLVDANGARDKGFDAMVRVHGHDPLPGLSLDLGNPHTVVALPDSTDLASLDLTSPPDVHPVPAAGTNVEFVRPLGPGHIAMRVHERGVGETRSCGTGAAAAALATRWWAGSDTASDVWRVDVPGGTLRVRALPGQQVELAGPAVLVADGVMTLS